MVPMSLAGVLWAGNPLIAVSYTPMEFLRHVRMRLARQRLLHARPGDSVTGIATRCGFAHLGRFAVDYKRRFGESPSETLERAKRGTSELADQSARNRTRPESSS